MRWLTVAEAERIQCEHARQVRLPSQYIAPPLTVAGLDVSYETGSDRLVAAAVVVDCRGGQVLEESVVFDVARFPYVPGLLAFREAPALLRAVENLRTRPELLLCDGHGIAHPRRCGLASHLGVRTGVPSVGCAKTLFIGKHGQLGPHRGARADLIDGDERVGQALRTRTNVKPVYVSPGHGIGVDQASDIVLVLCRGYRLPDPIRFADQLSRRALAAR